MKFISAYPRLSIAALILLMALAVVSFLRSGRIPSNVKDDLKTIQLDKVRQAEQLADTLASSSRVVVIEMDYAMKAHGDRVYNRVLDALKAKGLDVQHVIPLTIDTANGWDTDAPGFPYAEYILIADKFPETDAVIALCGPPYGVEQFLTINISSLPKLLVAGGVSGGSALSLCDQGWLHAATVPRAVMENGERVLKYELLTCR